MLMGFVPECQEASRHTHTHHSPPATEFPARFSGISNSLSCLKVMASAEMDCLWGDIALLIACSLYI